MVIRKLKGTRYKVLNSFIGTDGDGSQKQFIMWIECDEFGNELDTNNNGLIDVRLQKCSLKNNEPIDVSQLSEDCLNNLA